MQRVKEKAIQLLQDQIVDRVIGWRAGEFFYDLTPSVFTSVEDIEKNFVWSVFSGANLSKYLIAESRRGGKAAVFLKPCDSYSFVQLLKEHRILRETVYAVGVQCDGMCDMEAIKEKGLSGVTAVTEDSENLKVATIYGDETIKKADVLLLMTRLPELFTKEEKMQAWNDFEPLCLHDSTLSFASHALFALQNGLREKGIEYLRKALLLDLRDLMHNTGKEGLHLAGMGESWQAAAFPPFIQNIIKAGGLLKSLKEREA